MTSANSMHEAGHSKSVLRDNPEDEGGGRKMGASARMKYTSISVTDSCLCNAKIIILL